MNFLTVDESKCGHDGLCALECPMDLIYVNKSSGLPESLTTASEKCIKCGHCVAICPNGALSVNNLSAGECVAIDKKLNPSAEQVEQLIKSRRSTRQYSNKPVEKEAIEKLIDIARFAPTGGNSQMVEWLVYNSREKVREVGASVIEFMKEISKSGHPLGERYNFDALIKNWEMGGDPVFRGAPALIVAHAPGKYGLATVDASIALSYLDIAASSFQLGCCWAGFFMIAASQSKKVAEVLNLPEGNSCVGGLMIGYKQYNYSRIPLRNEPKIIWRN